MDVAELLTVGHGSLDRAGLAAQLHHGDVATLVDVRGYPGSRRNPDVGSDALSSWLPDEGVEYRWEGRLGGRRKLPAESPSPDTWWRVDAFRAYAAHTRTPDFRAALEEVLTIAATSRTVVMCAESVWWRCHRRLIADVAVLAYATHVDHLMPDRRTVDHRPAEGARVDESGWVVWDRTSADRGPPEHT